MTKPDWCPQWAWDEAREAVALDQRDCAQIGYGKVEKIWTLVSRALIEAEQRGMERAAKIVEGEAYHHRYRTWPFWPEQKDGTRGNISNESEIARHCDNIAAAIRAAAKEIEP